MKGNEGAAKRICVGHTIMSTAMLKFPITGNCFVATIEEKVKRYYNTYVYPDFNHTSLGMVLLVQHSSRISSLYWN